MLGRGHDHVDSRKPRAEIEQKRRVSHELSKNLFEIALGIFVNRDVSQLANVEPDLGGIDEFEFFRSVQIISKRTPFQLFRRQF